MSYTPINWQNGDTITAEKMNKMDNGWSVETSGGELFSETVTTATDDDAAWSDLTYSAKITADSVTVTFNGTDYQCQKVDAEGDNAYGGWGAEGPDFTSIPFAILSGDEYNSICTPSAGTYTVKVVASTSVIETSSDFQMAARSVVDTSTMPMLCVSETTTQAEMGQAFESGRLCFFKPYENVPAIHIITTINMGVISFIPTSSQVTASFVDGVFIVSV